MKASRIIKRVALAVALAGLAGGSFFVLRGLHKPLPPAPKPVRPVKAVLLGDVTTLGSRSFPGRAKPTREVVLAFRVSGPLIELPVKVGQKVELGQLVARIDPRDYETTVRDLRNLFHEAEVRLGVMKTGARDEDIKSLEAKVQAARATLDNAETNYKRTMVLFEKDVASRDKLDKAVLARDVAAANLEAASQELKKARAGARPEDIEAMAAHIESFRAKLSAARDGLTDTSLRAPFAGHISAKYVDNFQKVRAQQPILSLEDHSHIEVTVEVPEEGIHYRDYIKKVTCTFQTIPNKVFPAQIKEVGTVASQQTQTYPVTVIMEPPPDSDILPGMAAEVRFVAELPDGSERIGFEVPETAIFADNTGRQYAWVFDRKASAVRRREVTAGSPTSHGIRVTSGLTKGEWVITAGVHYLHDDQKVRLLSDDSPRRRETSDESR